MLSFAVPELSLGHDCKPLCCPNPKLFAQIIIGIVVPLKTKARAAQVQNKAFKPTPLIQLVKRNAIIVAHALRTKQTATKPSPIIYE